jgi:hypothetical protein
MNYLICTGYGYLSIPSTPKFFLFHEFLFHQARETQMEWCVESIVIQGPIEAFVVALQQGQSRIVSSGSYIKPFATAACVMEDKGRECFISNKMIAPGGPTEMSAYRGEVTGLLAVVFIIHHLCNFFHVTTGKAIIAVTGRLPCFRLSRQIIGQLKSRPLIY